MTERIIEFTIFFYKDLLNLNFKLCLYYSHKILLNELFYC